MLCLSGTLQGFYSHPWTKFSLVFCKVVIHSVVITVFTVMNERINKKRPSVVIIPRLQTFSHITQLLQGKLKSLRATAQVPLSPIIAY